MAATRKGRKATDLPPASTEEPKKASAPKKAQKPSVPTAADYLRDLRAMTDVEPEDFAFYDDPLAWTGNVEEWIPTGILGLDKQLGGGWPIGRSIEIAGWESTGKSTIIDQTIAMAQRQDAVAVLIDSEQARETKYTRSLGVDTEKLIVHKAPTIEAAFLGLDRAVALQEAYMAELAKKKLRPPPMLILWDSLGGTPTKAEYDGAADDKHVMSAARAVKMNLRRLTQRISKARTAFVFGNQFYESMQQGLKTSGGSGVRYFSSVRLWLSKGDHLKVGDEVVGHIIEAKLKKTKVGIPKPPVKIGLIYGAGIHNAWTLWEWGKKHGAHKGHVWIAQRGAWSYVMLPDGTHLPGFQRTYIGFAEVLAERPDVYAQMVAGYMQEAA